MRDSFSNFLKMLSEKIASIEESDASRLRLIYVFSFFPALTLLSGVLDRFSIVKELGWVIANISYILQSFYRSLSDIFKFPELTVHQIALITTGMLVFPSAIRNFISRRLSVTGFFAAFLASVIVIPPLDPKISFRYVFTITIAVLVLYFGLYAEMRGSKRIFSWPPYFDGIPIYIKWSYEKKTVLYIFLSVLIFFIIISMKLVIFEKVGVFNAFFVPVTAAIAFFMTLFTFFISHAGRVLTVGVANALAVLAINWVILSTGAASFNYKSFKDKIEDTKHSNDVGSSTLPGVFSRPTLPS